MEATFRLARQTSRWARFAEVTVRIAAAAKNEVVTGDDAFAWRREVYGPNAWSGGPYDHDPDSAPWIDDDGVPVFPEPGPP